MLLYLVRTTDCSALRTTDCSKLRTFWTTDWVVAQPLTCGADLVSLLGTSEAQLTVDMVTGDRAGRFHDPAGYLLKVRTRLEAVSAEAASSRVKARRSGPRDDLSAAQGPHRQPTPMKAGTASGKQAGRTRRR